MHELRAPQESKKVYPIVGSTTLFGTKAARFGRPTTPGSRGEPAKNRKHVKILDSHYFTFGSKRSRVSFSPDTPHNRLRPTCYSHPPNKATVLSGRPTSNYPPPPQESRLLLRLLSPTLRLLDASTR